MRSEFGCAIVAIATVLTGCRPGAGREVKALAILPFENLSPDPALEWMGRAFAEDLRFQLSGSSIDPSVAAALRDVTGSGAGHLLEGYYSVGNGRLRVTAVLEDASTSREIRTLSAEGPVANGMIPLAASIARELDAKARPPATANPEAMREFATALTAPDPVASNDGFQRAVREDPGFSAAYLAWVQALLARGDRAKAAGVLADARFQAARFPVLERERLNFLSAALANDVPGERKALVALAAAAPGDAGVFRTLGELDTASRAYAGAASWYEKAVNAQPDDIVTWNNLGYARMWSGDLDGAVQAFTRYRNLRPNDANPLDSLADAYYYFGRFDKASELYSEAHRKSPSFLGGGELYKAAWARAMLGDLEAADALFGGFIKAREAAKDMAAPYRQAQWEFLTGRKERAFARLELFLRTAPLPAASLSWSQLVLWSLDTGDRARAASYASKIPGSSPLVSMARFLVEPPAPPAEWEARARRTFPNDAQAMVRRQALAAALLYAEEFAAAVPVLRGLYREMPASSPDRVDVPFAWALIETGNISEAVAPLKYNVPPDPLAEHPLMSLSFPRVFHLRATLAEKQGRSADAKREYALFHQYSGSTGRR